MSSTGDETVFPFLEPESFVSESRAVIDFIANYYSDVENYPVQSRVKPGYLKCLIPENPPLCAESLETILQDVSDSIIPGLTHWQSPNYFAYFQANASTAGFLGEMLCTGFNVVGFNWIGSPAATELESIVIDWMGKMLNLPRDFLFSGNGGGVLLGSACEAVVCTLVAARDRAGTDNISKLVVYGSDQTHFVLHKASKIVGIPSKNFRNLKTSASNDFALSPEDVRAAMVDDIKNGLIPLYLCASIGTTACGAVDPIEELGKIARDYNVWLHIDAAYAGSACICPEFRHYLDGVELVQSVSMSPHKWFLTNMDCCCLWVKNPSSILDSLSTDSDIMRNSFSEAKEVVDYRDWQISLSKRFRAVKLWVVIRRYGFANLMQHIRSDVSMAKRFEECVAKDDRFEVLVPRKFALVCFRLKPKFESEGSELNQKLLSDINSSGRAFMTQAIVGGKFVIRCAIGSTLTEVRHVNDLWKLIQEKADKILCWGMRLCYLCNSDAS